MALGRGSGPKKNAISELLLLSKELPKIAVPQRSRFGVFWVFLEFLWKCSLAGMVPAGRVGTGSLWLLKEKKKNNKTNQSSHRMINSGGKALGERERSWERGAAFAAFSPMQFSGHLREFFSLCQLFWDHIPARACLGSAGP